MDKIRLIFKGISEIVGSEEVGVLVLTDETETRQISITCDKAMLYQFELRMQCAPVVGRLLPEVLWKIISTQSELGFELMINGLIDGQYRALIYNKETLEPVSLRASDAVLLAYISKIPLYIEAGLMQKQSVEYYRGAKGMALPVNSISNKMLKSALDKAIKDEDYELASHLRDEMRRRKIKE